jgi:hypothetical protein
MPLPHGGLLAAPARGEGVAPQEWSCLTTPPEGVSYAGSAAAWPPIGVICSRSTDGDVIPWCPQHAANPAPCRTLSSSMGRLRGFTCGLRACSSRAEAAPVGARGERHRGSRSPAGSTSRPIRAPSTYRAGKNGPRSTRPAMGHPGPRGEGGYPCAIPDPASDPSLHPLGKPGLLVCAVLKRAISGSAEQRILPLCIPSGVVYVASNCRNPFFSSSDGAQKAW